MKTISQSIINIEYILREKQLLSFFNKKELDILFFNILKNNGRNEIKKFNNKGSDARILYIWR